MAFEKGKSGNPGGRPKSGRNLTAILENVGSELVTLKGGDQITKKDLMARMLWDIISTGETQLANGKKLKIAAKDWFTVVQFLYKHIDGNAVQHIDVKTDDQPITPQVYLPLVNPYDPSDSTESDS